MTFLAPQLLSAHAAHKSTASEISFCYSKGWKSSLMRGFGHHLYRRAFHNVYHILRNIVIVIIITVNNVMLLLLMNVHYFILLCAFVESSLTWAVRIRHSVVVLVHTSLANLEEHFHGHSEHERKKNKYKLDSWYLRSISFQANSRDRETSFTSGRWFPCILAFIKERRTLYYK